MEWFTQNHGLSTRYNRANTTHEIRLRLISSRERQVIFSGIVMQDDFAIFRDNFLVVSTRGLNFLRDASVINAEADEIDMPVSQYFSSSRKYFWMPAEIRRSFE